MPHSLVDPAQITLAILAGGEGTRMGRPKARLAVDGEPILRFLLKQFGWPGPTLLVTAPGNEGPPGREGFDREVSDPIRGMGPLRGILTALEHCNTPLLAVATVDMPGITGEHLRWLAEALDSLSDALGLMPLHAVPGGEPRLEPFPCLLRTSARPSVQSHLDAGRRSVRSLVSLPGWSTANTPAEWDVRVWTNLNHPADLEAFASVLPPAPPLG
jgi:molybdenum cofactor guanylyltransferase